MTLGELKSSNKLIARWTEQLFRQKVAISFWIYYFQALFWLAEQILKIIPINFVSLKNVNIAFEMWHWNFFLLFCIFAFFLVSNLVIWNHHTPLTAFVFGRNFVHATSACTDCTGVSGAAPGAAVARPCDGRACPPAGKPMRAPAGHPLHSHQVGNFFPAQAHPRNRPLASSPLLLVSFDYKSALKRH